MGSPDSLHGRGHRRGHHHHGAGRPHRRAPRRRTTPTPVKSGAAWLSDQVTDGLVHNEQYDFDDIGLSIDVALGLDAAGKKADRRQGDHQGGRQERRLLHRVRAQRVRRPHGQGRRPRALAGQEPARLRRRRPGHAARGPRGDHRADHRPHRGRLRPDRRVRRRLRQRHRPGVRRPGAQPGEERQGRVGDGVPARAAVRQGLLPSVLHRRQDRAPTSPARAPRAPSAAPAPTPPRWRSSRCRT